GQSRRGRNGEASAAGAGSRRLHPQTTWPAEPGLGSDPSHGPRRRTSKRRLTAHETWFALGDEGLHALLLVLGREEHGEEGCLLRERRLVRALERQVERFLGVGEREQALRREHPSDLEHPLPQLAVVVHG